MWNISWNKRVACFESLCFDLGHNWTSSSSPSRICSKSLCNQLAAKTHVHKYMILLVYANFHPFFGCKYLHFVVFNLFLCLWKERHFCYKTHHTSLLDPALFWSELRPKDIHNLHAWMLYVKKDYLYHQTVWHINELEVLNFTVQLNLLCWPCFQYMILFKT